SRRRRLVGCWPESPPARAPAVTCIGARMTKNEWLRSIPDRRHSSLHTKREVRELAEGVGFEPTDPCGSPDFESGALDRAMRPLPATKIIAARPGAQPDVVRRPAGHSAASGSSQLRFGARTLAGAALQWAP